MCVGVFGWMGVAFNFLTVNVPILAFVISVALVIHPLWEWTRLRRRVSDERRVSLRAVAVRTFPGCFLSALTTTVGFGSLVLAKFGAVREFGLLTATARDPAMAPPAYGAWTAANPSSSVDTRRRSPAPVSAPMADAC